MIALGITITAISVAGIVRTLTTVAHDSGPRATVQQFD